MIPQPNKRYLQPLATILLLAIAAFALTAAAFDQPTRALRNFGKVTNNYYRGAQPGVEQLADLKRLGIRTIIDLRKDSEEDSAENARSTGLQYFNIPLSTGRPATEEQIDYFFNLIDDPANWPVYVHCKGGRHRTGEMTALYRITRDRWTADQAYAEMKKYDFENNFFYPRVLKRFVFSFYERFKTKVAEQEQPVSATSP